MPSDIDECLDDPCQNGATCMNNFGSFHCNCTEGWQGQNCEIGEKTLYPLPICMILILRMICCCLFLMLSCCFTSTVNRLYGRLARRDCETDRKRYYVVDQAHLLSQGINTTNKHSLSDKQTRLLFLSLYFQVERIPYLYIFLA